MNSDPSFEPFHDAGLTVQRLRVEAACRHEGIPVDVRAGRLRVLLAEGCLPVTIRRLPPGFRVDLRLHLGRCEAPGSEFREFIVEVNASREPAIIEVQEDGTTDLFWTGRFPQTIDPSVVVLKVVELVEVSVKVATELRERFFVSPLGASSVMEQEEPS